MHHHWHVAACDRPSVVGHRRGINFGFFDEVDFLCLYLACVGNDGLTNVALYPLLSFSQQTRGMATEKQSEYSAIADPITSTMVQNNDPFGPHVHFHCYN